MPTILVVDDDQQVRELLKTTFELEKYDVVTACDGCEAVNKFDPETIDLVVTDIVMPDKEGIETIREIRRINPNAKIIAISGGGRVGPDDYLKWAGHFGVDRTFTKPVPRKDLIDAVTELLK